MTTGASTRKQAARERVWDRLEREGVARFPYPPHGRIPNFAGAREAAEQLLTLPLFDAARVVKVNPDAPQRPLREALLHRGITVLVPTPRLRAGFVAFDPARIAAGDRRAAASLSRGRRFGRALPLRALPPIDVIVTGSVAVTRGGHRCGKGHGYADLEFGILRALGQPAPPVATTVHPLQLVPRLPWDPTDLPVAWIATPEGTLRVTDPPPPPDGIAWERLSPEDLEAMPVLGDLRQALGLPLP